MKHTFYFIILCPECFKPHNVLFLLFPIWKYKNLILSYLINDELAEIVNKLMSTGVCD